METLALSWTSTAVATITIAAALSLGLMAVDAARRRAGAAVYGKFYVVKYWIACAIIKIWKWISQRSKDRAWAIVNGQVATSLTDKARQLQANVQAIDSVYFCGFDDEGNWLVAKLCRRPANKCELWLTLHLAEDGLYECPAHPDTLHLSEQVDGFSAGYLTLEVLEDFRRWRLSYNGPMRKKPSELHQKKDGCAEEVLPHVKFTFIWAALTDPYMPERQLSTHLLAGALASESWSLDYFRRIQYRPITQFVQTGGFIGSVAVDGKDSRRMRLRGFRERLYGVMEWNWYKRYVSHFVVLEDGTFIYVSVVDIAQRFSRLAKGCIFSPNGEKRIIDCTSLSIENNGESRCLPAQYCFDVSSGSFNLKMRIRLRCGTFYKNADDGESRKIENVVDVTCHSNRGYGVAEFFYRDVKENEREVIDCDVLSKENVCDGGSLGPNVNANGKTSLLRDLSESWSSRQSGSQFIVFFDQDECTNSEIVGGKASQLGVLTKLQQQEGFTVPFGFCMTRHAFDRHVSIHPAIEESLKTLQLAASGQPCGCDFAAACDNIISNIKISSLSTELQLELTRSMTRAFGENVADKLFAVRSSAVGEDGEELSSAGQMATLLGVPGDFESLASAIVSCWSSQFSAQVVEYKRQHGQSISTGMGVVIQEMASPDTSGILFTRDPLTGNPSVMIMNANFGLGESIVSGISDPDTVKIVRLQSQQLKISEKRIGTKTYVTKTKVGGGTETIPGATEATVCCISDEDILRLCRLGLRLQELIGGPKDIEWALVKGNIYLLQARPITVLDQPEDFEIMTEFDSPHSRLDEFCTAANIGEVIPGVPSPLSVSFVLRQMEIALQTNSSYHPNHQVNATASLFTKISHGHLFFNFHEIEKWNKSRNMLANRRAVELSLIGQTLQNMTDEDVSSYHPPLSWFSRLLNALRTLYRIWGPDYHLKRWDQKLCNYTVTKSTTSTEIYDDICQRIPELHEVYIKGLLGTTSSVFSYNIINGILQKGKQCCTMDQYHDVATLLSHCDDVISATVPVMLQEIANFLQQDDEVKEFLAMSLQEATHWIMSERSGVAGASFLQFLKVHGHRSVRECDLCEPSWSQEPSRLVAILRTMVSVSVQAVTENVRGGIDELVRSLKTPLNPIQRWLIKRLLPVALRGVGRREWAKSLQVKMTDYFKQAFWSLAAAMKREGMLPEEELLFFFTHDEIGKFLRTRSAKLILRAQKRRKVYPLMAKLVFTRDHVGHPMPMQNDQTSTQETTISLTGTPVSLGTVRGRACVVHELSSASAIERGDILIVPYTDIGWSPYFPIISGLVTEIGGIISHGAVIAREYGIPCIVNCPRATEIFKTGELVELCAKSGSVKKLESGPLSGNDNYVNASEAH